MKRVAMRVDAGRHIGAGHVMRCLTLADALTEHDMEITFICRPFPEDLTGLIETRGHRCVRLTPSAGPIEFADSSAHAAWLGVPWERDRDESAAVLAALGPVDLMIVDHYGLDDRWERALAPYAARIVVVDDLADRAHACAILVDHTVGRRPSAYLRLVQPGTMVLAGPRYAPLAPGFAAARRNHVRPITLPCHLLISFGAVDLAGCSIIALAAAMRLPESLARRISVLVTDLSPHRDALRALAGLDDRVSLAVNVRDMPGFLSDVDVALGAGGISSIERCALGIPQLIVEVAANQRENARGLAAAGAARFLNPGGGKVEAAAMATAIATFLEDEGSLGVMAERARSLVDGEGTEVIVGYATAPIIRIRPARAEDAALLLEWRNDDHTRAMSIEQAEVDPGAHRRWLESVIACEHRMLLLAEIADRAVGTVRFDAGKDTARVSIALDPKCRGKRLAKLVLNAAMQYAHERGMLQNGVSAVVRRENTASIALFESCGFTCEARNCESLLCSYSEV